MYSDNAIGGERSTERLDAVFDALRHRYRRSVIETLSENDRSSVDDLAAPIAREDDEMATADVRIALVHSHLPRLADAGIVRFDRDDGQVELVDDADAPAVLEVARDEL